MSKRSALWAIFVSVLLALFCLFEVNAAEAPLMVVEQKDLGRIYVPDSPVDKETQDIIFEVCGENGADEDFPYLMITIGEYESGGDEKAISSDGGDIGLFQIHKSFHGARMAKLGVTDLKDAEQNTKVSYDILDEYSGAVWSNTVLLMAYNEGVIPAIRDAKRGHVTRYARNIIKRYNEVMDYVYMIRDVREKEEKRQERKLMFAYVNSYDNDNAKIGGANGKLAALLKASEEYVR